MDLYVICEQKMISDVQLGLQHINKDWSEDKKLYYDAQTLLWMD